MLCVACAPNLVAVGSFDKRVLLWDPRCGTKPIHTYSPHRRAVLKLCLLEEGGVNDTVVSISEDRTLAVWDIRASKLLKGNVKVLNFCHIIIIIIICFVFDKIFNFSCEDWFK